MTMLKELFRACAFDVEYQTVGNDVNYAFVEDDDTLYVFFQGSSSVTDWIRNFLFGKKPYKDMEIPYRVHRGFLSAWKEVEDIVIEKIDERDSDGEYKWNKVVVVGYSHGGALAGLCHECVWYHRPDLRDCGLIGFGFEAPRFYAGFRVKKALRERWSNFFIVRTNNDIVTHCPPVIFKYTHVGDIIQIYGDISLAPNKWWIPKCVKSHYPDVVYDALVSLDE